jgi:predicted nucleotidyltransferase
MTPDRAVADARAVVAEGFPGCRAAWLGGSVVRGIATRGSDLDITVLIEGPPAPYRDSRRYASWPVELFVHSERSLQDYVSREVTERRPALPRLVGESVVLVDRDGSGFRWQQHCLDLLHAGPAALTDEERDRMRYGVTDLLDDLAHADAGPERVATAMLLAQEAQRLLLLGSQHWVGTGKWLTRELADLDRLLGEHWVSRFTGALVEAANGDVAGLGAVSSDVLDRNGGPLFEGYRARGRVPEPGPAPVPEPEH